MQIVELRRISLRCYDLLMLFRSGLDIIVPDAQLRGRLTTILTERSPEPRIIARFEPPTGGPSVDRTIPLELAAATLMAAFRRLEIPIPRDSEKTLVVEDDGVAFEFRLTRSFDPAQLR